MQSLVFDLDGTLLDTLADIADACNTVLGRNGYPQHPLAAYKTMVGNGFDNLIKCALPADRMPEMPEIRKITQDARIFYGDHLTIRTKPYPGMLQTLSALAEAGKKLAVLSNKPDAMSARLIDYYFPNIPFAIVQGARSDVALKPDPGALLAILETEAVQPGQACYIGDSNVDMQTARNAGVAGIGAAWGFRGRDELLRAGATLVIDEPPQLLNLTIPTR